MKTDPKETRLGALWFFIASPIAICLVIFLALFDHNKTTYGHEAEQEHADMLREIRVAQASMGGSMLDPRIKAKAPAKSENDEVVAHEESHAESHAAKEASAHH